MNTHQATSRLSVDALFASACLAGAALGLVLAAALVLDGATLADIYLGKVARWNDARIAAGGAPAAPDAADWPILGKTYILTRTDAPAAKKAALAAFFDWCFAHGGPTAKAPHDLPVAR